MAHPSGDEKELEEINQAILALEDVMAAQEQAVPTQVCCRARLMLPSSQRKVDT